MFVISVMGGHCHCSRKKVMLRHWKLHMSRRDWSRTQFTYQKFKVIFINYGPSGIIYLSKQSPQKSKHVDTIIGVIHYVQCQLTAYLHTYLHTYIHTYIHHWLLVLIDIRIYICTNVRVCVCVCANPGRPFAAATEFCTVTSNICGFSVWNLLHVTSLAWLLDFWKIYAPPRD